METELEIVYALLALSKFFFIFTFLLSMVVCKMHSSELAMKVNMGLLGMGYILIHL